MTVVCCLAPLSAHTLLHALPDAVTLRMVDVARGREYIESCCTAADVVIGDTLHRVALDADFFAVLKPGAFVQQPSVGFDEVDVEAAEAQGVTVANAAGYNSAGVADWVIGATYSLVRGLHWRTSAMRAGDWPDADPANELSTQTIGLIGYGNIGQMVATRLAPLVADVVYCDQRAREGVARRTDMRQLLTKSDVVSVQLPLTLETRGMIGSAEMATMRRGAYLISAGRGGVVDENALAQAITSDQLGGAAVDVFGNEPLDLRSPLRRLDRVLLSPHVAGDTVQSVARLVEAIADNVARVMDGRTPRHMLTATGSPAPPSPETSANTS